MASWSRLSQLCHHMVPWTYWLSDTVVHLVDQLQHIRGRIRILPRPTTQIQPWTKSYVHITYELFDGRNVQVVRVTLCVHLSEQHVSMATISVKHCVNSLIHCVEQISWTIDFCNIIRSVLSS